MIEKLTKRISDQYINITGIQCSIEIMEKGDNHAPSILHKGQQGVYVFYRDDFCFKVGKAGPKSKARWNSHHYNLDKTTPSTMTKSFMKDLAFFKSFFEDKFHCEIDSLNPSNIKDWVKNNISRVEFKISSHSSKHALSLLESLVQFNFNPVYEGKTISKNKINNEITVN